jgi:hypothetical protein
MNARSVCNAGLFFVAVAGLIFLAQSLSHAQTAAKQETQRAGIDRSGTQTSGVAQAQSAKSDGGTSDRLLEETLAALRKEKVPPPILVAHDRWQSEPVDPSWGPAAGKHIASYLHSHLGDRIDISLVDCRTDLCEVTALGRGSDSSRVDQDMRDWHEQWHGMPKEPWWTALHLDEKKSFCGVADSTGRLAVLCFAARDR